MLESMAFYADIIPIYHYLGRCIDISGYDYQSFPIVLTIDGIDTSPTATVSML
jgi:hypothetical protein